MRTTTGRRVEVNDADVYVEVTGRGEQWVVFEAGMGCGRTCWDPVVDHLQEDAHLVAYDRSGFGRSSRDLTPTTFTRMSADLDAMIRAVVPRRFVLVAHSMGAPIARLAAVSLADRLDGLVLVDPMPELAPVYDQPETVAKSVDRRLALAQPLMRIKWVRRAVTRNMRELYAHDTYATMLVEDFTRAGIVQTRRESRATYDSIPGLRENPPGPPSCPVVVLSATRARRGHERTHDEIVDAQRAYVETLPHGTLQSVDAGHFIQAEEPDLVAETIQGMFAQTPPSDP